MPLTCPWPTSAIGSWGLSSYAGESPHYADWAIIKVDRSIAYSDWKQAAPMGTPKPRLSKPSVTAWFKADHFPSEPVFVPRNSSASAGLDEDDGVILAQVLDGLQKRTYLVVLDASTMTELALASLDPGLATPYTQHGRWFSQS